MHNTAYRHQYVRKDNIEMKIHIALHKANVNESVIYNQLRLFSNSCLFLNDFNKYIAILCNNFLLSDLSN